MMSIDGLIRDLMALNRVARSGSPSRLRVTWRNLKNPRTLATLAARAEKPPSRQPAQRPGRVASVLEQLINRTENK